jgi:hypothetical protein
MIERCTPICGPPEAPSQRQMSAKDSDAAPVTVVPSWRIPARCGGSVDEPAGARDLGLAAFSGQQGSRFVGFVECFDDAMLSPVVQPPELDASGFVNDVRIGPVPGGISTVVDEEHTAVGGEQRTDQGPGLCQPRPRDVRQPEGEEHRVEACANRQREDVGVTVVVFTRAGLWLALSGGSQGVGVGAGEIRGQGQDSVRRPEDADLYAVSGDSFG